MRKEQLEKLQAEFNGDNTLPLVDQLCSTNKRVFGRGNPDSPILVVGEAPGREEGEQGLPFVGASGKLLSKAMEEAGVRDVYITNIVKIRPPNNRDPTIAECAAHIRYLKEQIRIITPVVILCVGRISYNIVLRGLNVAELSFAHAADDPIPTPAYVGKAQGNAFISRVGESIFHAVPIYHPSYILRNEGKTTLWKAWIKAIKMCTPLSKNPILVNETRAESGMTEREALQLEFPCKEIKKEDAMQEDTLDFQILWIDWDDNNRVFNAFGRTAGGETVHCRILNFKFIAYMQVPATFNEDIHYHMNAIIKKDLPNMHFESRVITGRRPTYKFSHTPLNAMQFVEFAVDSPNSFHALRRVVPYTEWYEYKFTALEQLTFRRQLVAAGWIRVVCPRYRVDKMSTCDVEIECAASCISVITDAKYAGYAPQRLLAFDTETLGLYPENSGLVTICSVLQVQDKQLESDIKTGISNSMTAYCFQVGECNTPRYTEYGCTDGYTYCFKTEKAMLLAWFRFRAQCNADMVIGHNSKKFDMAFIVKRANILGIKNWHMGRLINTQTVVEERRFKTRAFGERRIAIVHEPGIIHLDTLELFYRTSNESSYKLDHLANKYLKSTKNDVPYPAIPGMFNGSCDDRRELVEYCLQDANLCLRLVNNRNALYVTYELARVCRGVYPTLLYSEGVQRRVIAALWSENVAAGHRFLLDNLERKTQDMILEDFYLAEEVEEFEKLMDEMSLGDECVQKKKTKDQYNIDSFFGGQKRAVPDTELLMNKAKRTEHYKNEKERIEWQARNKAKVIVNKRHRAAGYVGALCIAPKPGYYPSGERRRKRVYADVAETHDEKLERLQREETQHSRIVLDRSKCDGKPVLCLDVSSMYPSIQQQYNISLETMVVCLEDELVEYGLARHEVQLSPVASIDEKTKDLPVWFVTHQAFGMRQAKDMQALFPGMYQFRYLAIKRYPVIHGAFADITRRFKQYQIRPCQKKNMWYVVDQRIGKYSDLDVELVEEPVLEIMCDKSEIPRYLRDLCRQSANIIYISCDELGWGLIPRTVKMFNMNRKWARNKRDEYDEGTTEHTIYENMQLGLKILANSVYGSTGANGDMSAKDLGSAVTAWGRELIQSMVDLVGNHWSDTINVGGDTDSFFELFPWIRNVYEALEAGPNIVRFVNGHCPPLIQFTFEKAMSPFLFPGGKKRYASLLYTDDGNDDVFAKKRWIELHCPRDKWTEIFAKSGWSRATDDKKSPGWMFTRKEWRERLNDYWADITSIRDFDELKRRLYLPRYDGVWFDPIDYGKRASKGMETVRRDAPPFLKKLITRVFDMVFRMDDIVGAVEYAKSECTRLLDGGVGIMDLASSNQFSKEEYKSSTLPHLQIIEKKKQRGEAVPQLGDRVYYIYTKSTKDRKAYETAESPKYVMENPDKVSVDYEHYFENRVVPALRRIFGRLLSDVDNKILGKSSKNAKSTLTTRRYIPRLQDNSPLSRFVQRKYKCAVCKKIPVDQPGACFSCSDGSDVIVKDIEDLRLASQKCLDVCLKCTRKTRVRSGACEKSRCDTTCVQCTFTNANNVICDSEGCTHFFPRVSTIARLKILCDEKQ